MNKENKNTPTYEPPKMEMVDIQLEGTIMAMSGQGFDSDDSEFGAPARSFDW